MFIRQTSDFFVAVLEVEHITFVVISDQYSVLSASMVLVDVLVDPGGVTGTSLLSEILS